MKSSPVCRETLPPKRFGDRRRLLVDLLGHEVAVAALFRGTTSHRIRWVGRSSVRPRRPRSVTPAASTRATSPSSRKMTSRVQGTSATGSEATKFSPEPSPRTIGGRSAR